MRDWRKATVDKVAVGVLWFFRFVKGWAPRFFGGASSLAFILWGANGDVWKSGLPMFITGVVLAVLAFVAEFVVQNPSYMKLSHLREVAERKALRKAEALESAIEIMLARMGTYCGLQGHSDRISVYYFRDDQFFMVSRYAKNPVHRRRGRESYPADEGAIGEAWSADKGQALVEMPPGKDAWVRAARRQRLSDAAISSIRMKSRGLAGYRLETASQGSVGVLILESTQSKRISQEHLDRVTDSHMAAAIAELIAAFALMTPAGETFAQTSQPKRQLKWQAVPAREPQEAVAKAR